MPLNKIISLLENSSDTTNSVAEVLLSIIDSMADGVFVVNEKGFMIFHNKSSERILGYGLSNLPMDERVRLIGNYLPDMVTPFPLDRLPLPRAIKGEEIDAEEICIRNDRRPDGVFISVNARPLRNKNGEINGGISVFRDITAQKKAKLEQQKLEEQMFRSQKLESLGVLAGGIAHDFNNLLMGVLGNADLTLLDLEKESPVYERVSNINIAAKRLADLTQQLLTYSGQKPIVEYQINLSTLVEEMQNLLRPALSKKAQIEKNLLENIPPIKGDPTQLRQVVMNLITNASDAIGNNVGLISIKTGLVDVTEKYLKQSYISENLKTGPYVFIEIKDNGCGMSKETLSKIFDPFYTTKFTGRGLGLAAVIGIVKRHGGILNVESTPGKGSTFTILFPALVKLGIENSTSLSHFTDEVWQSSGLVLVVDDEDTVQEVVTAMLEKFGFDVINARTGKEAIDIFKTKQQDLKFTLLDMSMPDMNGDEVYRQIKTINNKAKIILSSGFHQLDMMRSLKPHEIATFLQKPYSCQQLLNTVKEALVE